MHRGPSRPPQRAFVKPVSGRNDPAPRVGRQRRSLSIPRAPGMIYSDGDRRYAEGLMVALRAAADDHEVSEQLTHPFHTYPARLHPATARVLVEIVGENVGKNGKVLDPFCGSGTTLVELLAAGIPSIGVDLNPLAILIARAKTWTAPVRRRALLRDLGQRIFGEVLAAGKAARRSGAETAPMRKPVGFDPNARNRRLASWFAPHVRRELEQIAMHIDDLREDDAEIADILTACLSASLYKVSSRTSDTDSTWVARNVPRGAAARHFLQRVELLVAGLADLAPGGGPPTLFELDARRLGEVVPDGSVEGVITSPPYAGTYDYADHQRLRFDFLGLRHRDMDTFEIGSRRSFLAGPQAERLWRGALVDTFAGIQKALAPGALAAIIIGDSWAGGRAMYALDDVRGALSDDLFVEAWASQQRPTLGGERKAFDERPKAEHIILLRRR